jgi:hypothetical protein
MLSTIKNFLIILENQKNIGNLLSKWNSHGSGGSMLKEIATTKRLSHGSGDTFFLNS